MVPYLDVLTTDNRGEYSISVAKVFGLETACYFEVLANITSKANRKKKADANGFVLLDRDYIKERTTLSMDSQYNCDAALQKAEIVSISKSNKDKLIVDVEKMFMLIANTNEDELNKLSKKLTVSKTEKSVNKRDAMAVSIKKQLVESDPELRLAYNNWIDAVYAAKKFLTKTIVDTFRADINNFTKDKNVKLQLLKFAMIHAYTDATWVINNFSRNTPVAKQSPSLITNAEVLNRAQPTPMAVRLAKNIKF